MNSTIKYKFGLFAALILLSFYLLVPTLFQFDQIRAEAAKKGDQPPSYFKIFPDKGINLGLDLRGGLYVELDVDLKEALKNRLDSISIQIEKQADAKEFPGLTFLVNDNLSGLTVNLSADKQDAFSALIQKDFGDVFVVRKNGDATLQLVLVDNYVTYLKTTTLKQAVEAVRNRVDRYGVAEASIQLQGQDRIIVEIPGVQDPDRVINIIRKTGLLEFRIVDDSVKSADLNKWISEARESAKIPAGYDKEVVDQISKEIKTKLPQNTELMFEVERDPVSHEIVSGVPYVVAARAEVTGDMLRNAQVGIANNEPHVSLSFNKVGTKNFGDVTEANVGKKLAIILDGFVTKAPVIQTAILNGEAQITFGFGNYQNLLNEAEDLSLLLREGALPASLKVATRTVVGPTLGADSIHQGLLSMLVAALVIILFMAIYYKLGGVLANVALLINMLFLFAILALLQASLSLPGIAGIVLTMGMAVDANVIIFERMREERRAGKAARVIIQSGYEHAMSAIVDSNLTTLIAGVVLYQFGTGPIKGFATTLMIGIVTTMITAVVMTRVVYDYFLQSKKITHVSV